MTKNLFLSSVAACVVVLVSGSAATAADNWVGTWKLTVAKSKYSPGPAPQSQTLKFEATPDGIKLTSDGVDADGKPMHSEYTAKFDGTDAPWTGNPNADTAAPKRIDAKRYRNTWKKDGKVTVTANAVVSRYGKTLTITQTGTDAEGRAVNTIAVYDRQ